MESRSVGSKLGGDPHVPNYEEPVILYQKDRIADYK